MKQRKKLTKKLIVEYKKKMIEEEVLLKVKLNNIKILKCLQKNLEHVKFKID